MQLERPGYGGAKGRANFRDEQTSLPASSRGFVASHRRAVQTQVAVPSLSQLKHIVQECSIDNWRSPLSCDVPDDVPSTSGRGSGIVVALGKFDAMHRGHRSLAMRAAQTGGHPFLLSFSGMAEVLGWPQRLPLIAPPDRPRVLSTWAPWCGGRLPRQRMVPFHEIRGMSPEEFVALLACDLRASGVVAGRNYRFGFRAKGDAEALQRLGAQYGMRVDIVDLLSDSDSIPYSPGSNGNSSGSSIGSSGSAASVGSMSLDLQGSAGSNGASIDGEGSPTQISSSKIRELLASTDVRGVQRLLGRPYRLVTGITDPATVLQPHNGTGSSLLPASTFLNQPPAPGRYLCGCAVVPLMQGTHSSSKARGGAAAGSMWEPLTLRSLLSGANDIPTSAAQGNGSHVSSSSRGSTAGAQMESRVADTPAVFVQAGLCEVQLKPQGLVLEPSPGGLLEQLRQLGDYPCYVVLDFDSSMLASR